MKLNAVPLNPEFTPIRLTIDIESKQELNTLFQLGNYNSCIASKLKEVTAKTDNKVDKSITQDVLYLFFEALNGY